MRRIGLLGGSFNPAHRGHRRISLAAARLLGLDEVWWLVSPGNPLKTGDAMAPYAARMRSARRAAACSKIKVSDFERRFGTRFTIDTVKQLRRRYPKDHFVWLMGADILPQLHRWRSWRQFARTVPIAVVPRPGYDREARAARAMGWLRRFVRPASQATRWTQWSAPAILLLRLPPDPTSATAIRALDPIWHDRPTGTANGTNPGHMPSFLRRPLARPD